MSHEITRMFASHADAKSAAADLAEDGFDEVFIVAPPADAGVPLSAIAAQIAQGNVLLADARIYAKGVAAGGTLLTVHAPFASGLRATSIIEAYKTIPTGKPEPVKEPMWDDATPFSSVMHMSLLSDDPTPASRFMGIPPLTGSDCSFSSMIGMPLLSGGSSMGEGRWGMPFLSSNATPLSSMLGLPLLKDSKRKGW
jgi:hypothetical protein